MLHFITLSLALALINKVNSQIPTTGNFILSSFQSKNCTGPFHQGVYSINNANCWDTSSLYGMYTQATGYSSNILSTMTYATVGCTGNSTTMDIKCDGSCVPASQSVSFSCLYSNYPSGNTNYTLFSDSVCSIVKNSTTYNPTQYCWTLDGMDSAFPTYYNSTSKTVSILSYPDLICGQFASNSGTFGTLTCDGTCQADVFSASYYECSYSNSAKLVASLIVTFVLMLILA